MKFTNRHNELVTTTDGRQVWISRSVAVVSLVLARHENQDYVVVVHRHPKATVPNKWCLPCGFLDWDETAGDAAIRETWEESGLDLHALCIEHDPLHSGIFHNQPWAISTETDVGNQNVVFHFASYFELETLPRLHLENTELDELQDAKWLPIEAAVELDMAFKHNTRIKQFMKVFNASSDNVLKLSIL